jgi:hypothetical protein
VQRHRDAVTAGGATRFLRDALFWMATAGAGVCILWLYGWHHDAFRGFATVLEPESDGLAAVTLAALVVGFGLLMAWCAKRVRDAARSRTARRDGTRDETR